MGGYDGEGVWCPLLPYPCRCCCIYFLYPLILNVHQRADFINLLHDLAAPYMTLRLSSRVVSVCPSASSPSVTLSSGQTISCDLVIGADGIKSIVREVVVGHPDNAVKTGDAAYRAIISTEAMMKDKDLRPLVEFPEMTGWMGPGRHIVGYCIVSTKP